MRRIIADKRLKIRMTKNVKILNQDYENYKKVNNVLYTNNE
ncbi:unnamed protein product [marine sediment metagenome]|uniref:Uncharacterized protein n=1 Tax=marine sediment metagenome TaxID=412755 RepID=X1SBW9_9ZZZZ